MFKEGDQVFNIIKVAYDHGQTDNFEIGTVFEVTSGTPGVYTDGSLGIWVRELSTLRPMLIPEEFLKRNTRISRLLYLR